MDIMKRKVELGIKPLAMRQQSRSSDEGNTIPFIARFRKRDGALDDEMLRL